MNKTTAIKSLQNLISDIDDLQDSYALSSEHTKWITNSLYTLEEIFGQNSRIFKSFAIIPWRFRGMIPATFFDIEQILQQKNQEAFLNDLETARGLLEAGIAQIKLKGMENVYEGKSPSHQSSDIVKIISLIDTKLRKTIRSTPQKEKEVQDALENLFIAALDKEFTREKENLEYAGKSYIPDFIFKKINTVVEAKLCYSRQREKEIIDEINADIAAYKTKYANLIFVIYDLGIIRDMDKIKNRLENENVIISIVKH